MARLRLLRTIKVLLKRLFLRPFQVRRTDAVVSLSPRVFVDKFDGFVVVNLVQEDY